MDHTGGVSPGTRLASFSIQWSIHQHILTKAYTSDGEDRLARPGLEPLFRQISFGGPWFPGGYHKVKCVVMEKLTSSLCASGIMFGSVDSLTRQTDTQTEGQTGVWEVVARERSLEIKSGVIPCESCT